MSTPLDNNLCKELGKLVETLTHTGQKTLDKDLLKKFKNICKKSDGYVEHAYHLLIYQLQKAHAEIRFSSFQICDELFRRSHCFRELLISNLQHVIELTCETSDHPLPPPRSVAINLKRTALQAIQDWNNVYGNDYKRLQLGYNFLKHCKKVDFNAIQLENSAEQAIRQEQERRLAVVNEEKVKRITTEIKELQPEISSTVTSLENCLNLLLPTPENFFIQDENDEQEFENESASVHNKTDEKENKSENKDNFEVAKSDDIHMKPSTSKVVEDTTEVDNSDFESGTSDSSDPEDEGFNFREYGIINPAHGIEVNVNTGPPIIKETAENSAIFENAKDMYTLISNRYLPTVKKWIHVLSKSSANSQELKKIIDTKLTLESAIKKYLQLKELSIFGYASDSSDSDFEEVKEKEGFEKMVQDNFVAPAPSVSANPVKNKPKDRSIWNIWSEENNEKDPTSGQSTLSSLKSAKKIATSQKVVSTSENNMMATEKPQIETPKEIDPKPSTSKENPTSKLENDRKAKLLAIAPKVPFDIDLYHWEDDKIKVPTMVAVRAEGSRFWHSTQEELEEVPVPDGVTSIRTRVIEFAGKFEPVQWSCRVPLPSGKLCPRRDRHKCPFHGPIVPRDKTGKCSNPEDAEKMAIVEEEKNQETPDWQDPQLLEDIKQATGIDLKIPEKKKKGKKHKKKDKFPGLTDINARKNTAYARLSKKIFKKGAMRRIARTMDAIDHKRFRDKYGDQFHYMHDTA